MVYIKGRYPPVTSIKLTVRFEEACVSSICDLRSIQFLKLNDSNTVLLILCATRTIPELNLPAFTIGDSISQSSTSGRNLEVIFDQHLFVE